MVLLLICSVGHTAPAMNGALCFVEGQVRSLKKREQPYQDEQWRKAWGLPKVVIYWDIELEVKRAEQREPGMGSCTTEELSSETFQLRDEKELEKVVVGKCLQGLTQFSGDEFRIGQWLYDLSECEQKN